MRHLLLAATVLTLATPALAQSREGAPPAAINRIIDEGTNHSQVVPTIEYLTDVIGPRLTNSPAMRRAEAWTEAKFREWGLKNVHKEAFPFGRGWEIERSSVRMVSPRAVQLTAIPIAWTPGTGGAITAPVVVAPMRREADFARWKGKLAGRIVMISAPVPAKDATTPALQRLTDRDLADLDEFQQPRNDPQAFDHRLTMLNFHRHADAFMKSEGALAYVTMSGRDGKLVSGEGRFFGIGETLALPGVQIAQEDYLRLARLAAIGQAPTLEIDTVVRFDDSDPNGYNVIADIPGTDPRAGYVMAGAHLDSWVAGDGAADNGAGSAEVMEAARILAAIGARPRRTIRFALWAGEEQGLIGSRAYVEQHLATRGAPGAPVQTGQKGFYDWENRWPIALQPEHARLDAYFNIDNGSGRLRGLYAERNAAVVPIFREWLAPFKAFGADTVALRPTGSTDHVSFQAVGIPGFQFIQDPLDYDSRIHHSGIDTFDHLKPDDLRQGSIVLAGVLLDAADAAQPLPRPPVPTRPVVTDPFAYQDPE